MKAQKNDIFNYDFNWTIKTRNSDMLYKEECCDKYKKKGEKKCKKCPKRAA